MPKQTNVSESEKSKVLSSATLLGHLKFYMLALVAQWIERLPPEQEVEGSNPFKGTKTVCLNSNLDRPHLFKG